MESLDIQMGKSPLTLHNRYFSPDNDYIKNFTFIVEDYCALPLSQDLFEYIMGKAKNWGNQIRTFIHKHIYIVGMIVYEQDWLVTTYMEMEATQDNVKNARKWLMDMGNAASKLNLTIQ
jgi:hypothetical protein